MASAPEAQAQQALTTDEFIAFLEALQQQGGPAKYLTMFGVSTATVGAGGSGFISATGVTPRGGIAGNGPDYDMAVGLSFGDANETVGAQLTANITGTQPFADAGYFSLKFSRALNAGPTPTYAAVSFSRLSPWGNIGAGASNDPTTTVSVTHINSFSASGDQFPIMLTAGYGSHISNNGADPGAFAGIGVGLTENFGVSVSANADRLNAGIGFSVPGVPGLGVTAGVYDVSNRTGRQQASVTVSYSVQNLFGGY